MSVDFGVAADLALWAVELLGIAGPVRVDTCIRRVTCGDECKRTGGQDMFELAEEGLGVTQTSLEDLMRHVKRQLRAAKRRGFSLEFRGIVTVETYSLYELEWSMT